MQETLYVLRLVFSGINLYVHINLKIILQNFVKMKKGSQHVGYKYRYLQPLHTNGQLCMTICIRILLMTDSVQYLSQSYSSICISTYMYKFKSAKSNIKTNIIAKSTRLVNK